MVRQRITFEWRDHWIPSTIFPRPAFFLFNIELLTHFGKAGYHGGHEGACGAVLYVRTCTPFIHNFSTLNCPYFLLTNLLHARSIQKFCDVNQKVPHRQHKIPIQQQQKNKKNKPVETLLVQNSFCLFPVCIHHVRNA